ncbi:MAG: TlpA family protein disulfide reductase [Myxococcota bacterium]|jgi:thiol-disulfide isomerase/thioredoxin|nr:TlpA family protein disulfide reductase [Myxococcota bacterium]
MDEPSPKTKPSAWSTRVGLVALAALILYLGSQAMGSGLLPDGTPAPQLRFPVAHGGTGEFSLSALRGQVVVLDFWSTSCPPCIKTMEALEAVAARNRDQGLKVVGIAVGGEDREEVARFGQQLGVSYPLVVGDDAAATAYRVRILPSLYVLGRDGRVVETHVGYWDRAGIAAAVRAALNEPTPKN